MVYVHCSLFHSLPLISTTQVTVPFRPLTELEQGKNLVDAAKETGLKFFVFR